jgi:hypothetical protein
MVPHDQQLGVVSPGARFEADRDTFTGVTSADLDSTFAIKQFGASARPAPLASNNFAVTGLWTVTT